MKLNGYYGEISYMLDVVSDLTRKEASASQKVVSGKPSSVILR